MISPCEIRRYMYTEVFKAANITYTMINYNIMIWFSLSNIARFSFLVKKRCCIAHFPLPRALLSSRRSMLPVHENVEPILPSPLSDVSQVAVNRPQGNGDSAIRKIRNPGLWNPESETLFDSFTWGDTVEKPSKSNSVNHRTVFIKVFFYPSMSVLF